MDDATADKRAAAGLIANLSSYLITVALTLLAAQAVIFTFVVDKRQGLTWCYVTSGLAASAFILSPLLGGKGMISLAFSGFNGTWKKTIKPDYFNLQATLLLLGVVCLGASAVMGTPKPEKRAEDISALTAIATDRVRIVEIWPLLKSRLASYRPTRVSRLRSRSLE